MRSTTILAVLTGAAVVMAVAAGTAGAATPAIDPGKGRVGVSLSPQETAALSEGPIPALVGRAIPGIKTGVHLAPGSYFEDDNGHIVTSFEGLFHETASHPGGYITAYLTDPNNSANHNVSFIIGENWN